MNRNVQAGLLLTRHDLQSVADVFVHVWLPPGLRFVSFLSGRDGRKCPRWKGMRLRLDVA